MNYSTHYNLNLVEGTDLVNPMSVDNPNYTAIDTAMYNNSIRVVDDATCIKTGTVHAVTRNNSNASVFKFTATGDWDTGDSMTVDGGSVTVFLPNGEVPHDNSFVINSEVLCILNGTRVTLYTTPNPYIPSADEIPFDNDNTVEDVFNKIGKRITIFEGMEYTSNDTWLLPLDAQAIVDSGRPYLVQAEFYYSSTYSAAKVTKVTQMNFGGHTLLGLNRSALEVGMVRITSTMFEEYGFSVNSPKLRNLYITALANY